MRPGSRYPNFSMTQAPRSIDIRRYTTTTGGSYRASTVNNNKISRNWLLLDWNDANTLYIRMKKAEFDLKVASGGDFPRHSLHRTTVFRQAAILLRAEASSWRRRNYKSLLLTLLSTLCIVLFIWSFSEAIEAFQGLAGTVSLTFGGPVGDRSTGSIPSCKNDVFMDPNNCYTVIFAPNTSEFRDVVDRMVRGCPRVSVTKTSIRSPLSPHS